MCKKKLNNDPEKHDKKVYIFLIIVACVCLLGLIITIGYFIYNQIKLSYFYEMIANCVVQQGNEIAKELLDYLERLQAIQKSSTTNDVMSFIYSALSTVLVGLCAGFVAKSYKNQETAKEATSAAKENADASKSNAEDAKNAADNASATVEKIEAQYNSLIKRMEDNLKIQRIIFDISNAKIALTKADKADATDKISGLNRKILMLDDDMDSEAVEQLLDELHDLENYVYQFSEKDPDDDSTKKAVERYNKLIDNAAECCERIKKD